MEKYDSLGIRKDTFKKFFELCEERKVKKIVETGTTSIIDWARAGCSTILFGEYCMCNNGHLWTIDNSPSAISESKSHTVIYSNNITYVNADSINVLLGFKDKIDALYLDSVDYLGDEAHKEISRQHHMKELQSAYNKLHDQSVIMVDDCQVPDGTMGKGELVIKWLKENGWEDVTSGYQIIMVKI